MSPYHLEVMPPEFHLQSYDDCGARGRQPHIRAQGVHTYADSSCPGVDARARSVAWGWKAVHAEYEGLSAHLHHVVAVTYANETFNARVQSLWAGSVCLHPAHPLPRGGSERLLFAVPPDAIHDGKLTLEFRLDGPVNVVVSAVELWADAPSPPKLYFADVAGMYGPLEGQVADLEWSGVAGASVTATGLDGSALASTITDAAGRFTIDRAAFEAASRSSGITLHASTPDGRRTALRLPADELRFEPVRYRPMPERVAGIGRPTVSLDGDWLASTAAERAHLRRLDDPSWRRLRVPGQWLQQGIDVPLDRHVAIARSFDVPAAWSGRRVILRFDAIHAGTHYRVNGLELGYSERLFTPVEWDITDAIRFGGSNRIDLDMVVDTESERLSYSSGYAFHNLGGIDRSVRLFALPQTHLRSLWVEAGLDADYKDGSLLVRTGVVGRQSRPAARLRIALTDALKRKAVLLDRPLTDVTTVDAEAEFRFVVPSPLHWTAETPDLYTLDIEIVERRSVIERVRRAIGFRRIEVRGSQVLLNGRPIKLAGACHHETHPLTGRADTARWARTDVAALKDANLNYLRTSHYPPNKELLDETDRQGVYVEVEAPFCWVGDETDMARLRYYLEPTSAMIDYHGHHPSVIIWSVANESQFNRCFETSAKLCKDLDPGRLTTFNNPDPKRICDIANVHYPRMPFDKYGSDDPRPLLLGEYFFPVCHEQTDVRRNPGLRELWGAGHSDPDSLYGRACASEFEQTYMQPGEPPGAWTHIVQSQRVIGGAIWAQLDEPFYLPGGKRAGYAWVHGFWGITDAWRRPKPEQWLAKQIFSPVWFPLRRLPFSPGQTEVEIPVVNRFAFTDLRRIAFRYRCGRVRRNLKLTGAPGTRTTLTVPLPAGTKTGDEIVCEAIDASGRLIVATTMWLGDVAVAEAHRRPTQSSAQATPTLNTSPAVLSGALEWPTFHATRFDFADLWPAQPPFAVLPVGLPDQEARRNGETITVHQQWRDFEGDVRIIPVDDGTVRIDYDFTHRGEDFHAREIGLRLRFSGHNWEFSWRRWSEWGDAPADSILRRERSAKPFRGRHRSTIPENRTPRWPWSLDETEEGTADFRSVKLNVLSASLRGADGSGLDVLGNGDLHVRAAIEGRDTALYILSRCSMGPAVIRRGARLRGSFRVAIRRGALRP